MGMVKYVATALGLNLFEVVKGGKMPIVKGQEVHAHPVGDLNL